MSGNDILILILVAAVFIAPTIIKLIKEIVD